jgi:hypothetical protein
MRIVTAKGDNPYAMASRGVLATDVTDCTDGRGPFICAICGIRGRFYEYVLPAITTIHNVVDRARILHSHGARHVPRSVAVTIPRQPPKTSPAHLSLAYLKD